MTNTTETTQWFMGEVPLKEFVQGPDGVEEWGIYPEPQDTEIEQTLIGIAFKPEHARLIASAPTMLEALMEMVLQSIDEDDTYSDDHLLFSCRECGSDAEDDHTKITHDGGCFVGAAERAIAKARGAA